MDLATIGGAVSLVSSAVSAVKSLVSETNDAPASANASPSLDKQLAEGNNLNNITIADLQQLMQQLVDAGELTANESEAFNKALNDMMGRTGLDKNSTIDSIEVAKQLLADSGNDLPSAPINAVLEKFTALAALKGSDIPKAV